MYSLYTIGDRKEIVVSKNTVVVYTLDLLKNQTIRRFEFEHEPELAPGLAEQSNAILTPHTASATEETRNKMAEMAAQNIIEALEGRTPLNLIK